MYRKGFSLLELMISVAIIGMLAAVAMVAFQKYMFQIAGADGAMVLSEVKRAEIIFVSEQPFSHTLFRDKMCSPSNRFAYISSFWSDSNSCDTRTAIKQSAPKGKKFICTLQAKEMFRDSGCLTEYDHTIHSKFPQLGQYNKDDVATGGRYTNNLLSPERSHFAVVAFTDPVVAAEYGVALDQTLSIRVIADVNKNSPYINNLVSSYMHRDANNSLLQDEIWTKQISMYYKDGEVKTSAGIYEVNSGE